MTTEHLKEKQKMEKIKKKIVRTNLRLPEQTFSEYYVNCVKLDISMNKQTRLLIEDFNNIHIKNKK